MWWGWWWCCCCCRRHCYCHCPCYCFYINTCIFCLGIRKWFILLSTSNYQCHFAFAMHKCSLLLFLFRCEGKRTAANCYRVESISFAKLPWMYKIEFIRIGASEWHIRTYSETLQTLKMLSKREREKRKKEMRECTTSYALHLEKTKRLLPENHQRYFFLLFFLFVCMAWTITGITHIHTKQNVNQVNDIQFSGWAFVNVHSRLFSFLSLSFCWVNFHGI